MVNNLSANLIYKGINNHNNTPSIQKKNNTNFGSNNSTQDNKASYSVDNLRAYQTTGIKTSLSDKEDFAKYSEISAILEPETRKKLSEVLHSGILLNNNSNDGSSVLDNLHKMAVEPRIQGLSAKNLVTSAIDTLHNPESITQHFGDVPQEFYPAIYNDPDPGISSFEELDMVKEDGSFCCVAASIEYNLAKTAPAEFLRMATGLSSESYSVTKNMKLSDINKDRNTALYILDSFKLPYKTDNDDNLEVTISPDRKAIIRARVQTSYQDGNERSALDVLMQSALMNISSQQTYNSLNDSRIPGEFSPEIYRGLSEIEATFGDTIFEGKVKDYIVYQNVDINGFLHPIINNISAKTVMDSTVSVLSDLPNNSFSQINDRLHKQLHTDEINTQTQNILTELQTLSSMQNNGNSPEDIPSEDAVKEFVIRQTISNVLKENIPDITEEQIIEITESSFQRTMQNKVKEDIINTLNNGSNVIVGYLSGDTSGHEITIIEAKQNETGDTIFVCNDTCDDGAEPILVSADYLLPKMHHAIIDA
ncbi:hypothetical protein IJG14_07735 [bacterium]|nr:hypothetical protein [bacterium]